MQVFNTKQHRDNDEGNLLGDCYNWPQFHRNLLVILENLL